MFHPNNFVVILFVLLEMSDQKVFVCSCALAHQIFILGLKYNYEALIPTKLQHLFLFLLPIKPQLLHLILYFVSQQYEDF